MESKQASRMDRKKEETQNKIITAAVALFHQYGLEAVTMEQIALAADIAKGTLYHYFPFKEAILNAYLQRSFRERNPERLEQIRGLPDTRARLEHIFALLIEGVQRQKEIFEAFLVYRMKQVLSLCPVEPESRSGIAVLIREILALGRQGGELRTDLPAEVLEGLFEYALIASVKPFYQQPEQFDARKAAQQAADLFLNGAKV